MEKKLRPPYPSTGQADEILDIFRRVSPKVIDSKFVSENKIATAPNASSVVNLVRWLGITDEENKVLENVASKLRLMGDERTKFVADLIKKAYKDILDGVNLQQAKREDLVNFFIHNYNYGIAPAKGAAILLLHLCEKYGIPISEELKKKTHNSSSGETKIEKKTKILKNRRIKNLAEASGMPEEGIIVLSIKGNGLNKQIETKNAEELQEAYDGRFRSFIDAAKHLFDEKQDAEDTAESSQNS